MLKTLFKRKKPRVFLGTIAVAPREHVNKLFDRWGMLQSEALGRTLCVRLEDLFSLPKAAEVEDPNASDLVLDVIVPKFQVGGMFDFSAGDVSFPIMWRPKITITARLYYLTTGQIKSMYTVTEKYSSTAFLKRVFSLRAIFNHKPVFDADDLEYLLYKACHKLLAKIMNKV